MFLENHPAGLEPPIATPKRSPYVFAWDEVQAALDRTSKDPEGRRGRRIGLEAPDFPTMALHMQRRAAGEKTRRYRTTANQIFCVIEGKGSTIIDGEIFDWSRGDVIAVPAWRPFEHHVASDSTLFSMTDEPALRAFRWLRSRDE